MVDSVSTKPARPIRVLNLIDGLSGGGSERLLWDTVRLCNRERLQHLVVTISPDWFGDFHYADRLRAAGAYASGPARSPNRPTALPRLFGGLRDFMRRPNPGRFATALRSTLQVGALLATFPRSIAAVQRHRPDVIHTHTFYSFVHGVFLGRLLRVPVVHTVPCLFSQMRGAGFGWLPDFYRWSREKVEIYFTGASVEDLHRAGISAKSIVPLRGGIDLAPIRVAAAERNVRNHAARERLGLPADATVALNIGRLHESKGQRHAITAIAELAVEFPTLHLVILGEGELRDELAAHASTLGVSHRVHLPGFWEEPLNGCAIADIYLRTNLLEGDNLSSLQALGMGVPVAGFATNQEIDVVRSIDAGTLVPVGDASALAGAVRTILSRPDRGASLGKDGAQHIDAHLGIDVLLQAYESAYRQVMGRTRPTTSRVKTALLWLAKITVTAAVMTFVLTHVVDWSTLTHGISSFPLSALFVLLALHMAQRVVVAWQTRLALTHAGIFLTTSRVFQLHLVTSFFSVVLPGDLAGAAVSWHLFSRDSGRRAQAAAALIYLRLIGWFVLVLVGIAGLFIEPRLLALHVHWIVLGAGLLVGLPLLSFHSSTLARMLQRISDRITAHLPWAGLRSAFNSFWSSVHEFTIISRPTLGKIWGAAAAAYLINVGAGWYAMNAAQIHAPASAIVWLLVIVNLVSLVPFTVAGFGLRELGIAVLLKQWYDVPAEAAVLLSLSFGVVTLLASAGFGGIALFFEVGRARGRKVCEA